MASHWRARSNNYCQQACVVNASLALALLLVFVTATAAASADVVTLAADDNEANSFFGFSVAISDDVAAIGAQGASAKGADSGAAYVFYRSNGRWCQQSKLSALDAQSGDQFGGSIALSGDTIVVGARRDDDRGEASGSAYVFVRTQSGWVQQAKLTAADGQAGAEFGRSIALWGDTAIIGAALDDANGEDSGSVYVFTRSGTTWRQHSKLVARDGAAGDVFGISVALEGDTALVGADLDDDNGENTGSVYVYTNVNGEWREQAKLTASDAGEVDIFGVRVAISGDTALIAARRDDDDVKGVDTGSAYVFVRTGTTWAQQAKLMADDAEPGDLFGYTVALNGDTGIVTAAMDDDSGLNSGAAYVFRRVGSAWKQQRKLTIDEGSENDVLGWSAALSNRFALIGAPTSIREPSGRAGLAYLFDMEGRTRTGTLMEKKKK